MSRGIRRRNLGRIGFPNCDFPMCGNGATDVHYITMGDGKAKKIHLCYDHHKFIHSKDGRRAEALAEIIVGKLEAMKEEKVIFT